MDQEQYELYENARNKLRQKKLLYYHFVFFSIASLFLFVANIYIVNYIIKMFYLFNKITSNLKLD